jgi:ribosome-binding protein aMBF1 (putative translation factor)
MDRVSALQAVDYAALELKTTHLATEAWRKNLIRAVRRAHAKADVSQAELARRTGLHRNTIAKWCSK